ncbi:A24 family peptidase [Paenibacillus alkaliterrae]|uniref:A24 family peptidase n=1 Tax=Paenibacillus alkaliterrae TaxID=320909 RepID=UPI001F47F46C|nr:A24 family peptidase [Paenibacillus alkaliterrae]MCF2940761.1 A24 family peptidase [Paenibacillus alkaliterrae]
MDIIQTAALAVLLIIAFVTDVKSQIIPNRLTVSFFAAAWLYQFTVHGKTGLIAAASGAAAGFVPLLLLHLAKGIGAGDVKLFAAIGAWAGVWIVLQMLFYAILYAGLIGIVLLLVNRSFGRKIWLEVTALTVPSSGWRKHQWLQWTESGNKFPFMLAVAPAAITVWSMLQEVNLWGR